MCPALPSDQNELQRIRLQDGCVGQDLRYQTVRYIDQRIYELDRNADSAEITKLIRLSRRVFYCMEGKFRFPCRQYWLCPSCAESKATAYTKIISNRAEGIIDRHPEYVWAFVTLGRRKVPPPQIRTELLTLLPQSKRTFLATSVASFWWLEANLERGHWFLHIHALVAFDRCFSIGNILNVWKRNGGKKRRSDIRVLDTFLHPSETSLKEKLGDIHDIVGYSVRPITELYDRSPKPERRFEIVDALQSISKRRLISCQGLTGLLHGRNYSHLRSETRTPGEIEI